VAGFLGWEPTVPAVYRWAREESLTRPEKESLSTYLNSLFSMGGGKAGKVRQRERRLRNQKSKNQMVRKADGGSGRLIGADTYNVSMKSGRGRVGEYCRLAETCELWSYARARAMPGPGGILKMFDEPLARSAAAVFCA
jgi:hypothetical protein